MSKGEIIGDLDSALKIISRFLKHYQDRSHMIYTWLLKCYKSLTVSILTIYIIHASETVNLALIPYCSSFSAAAPEGRGHVRHHAEEGPTDPVRHLVRRRARALRRVD